MTDPKGWQLFESCFKLGDEVVVVDVFDQFWWGLLDGITDFGCLLLRPGVEPKSLTWDDVRFMAHDGFPVRRLIGADGSATIEKLDTTDTQRAVRKALALEYPKQKPYVPARAVFGDPFDVEAASAKLYHPGNSGPGYWSRFWNGREYHSEDHREAGYETEEVLVLTAKDGAKAELWDLTTIYAFEVG
jgi:hypothetical protein